MKTPILALLPVAVLIGLSVYFKISSGCLHWDKPIAVEDNRACQTARAGDWNGSESRYETCLRSLGYRLVKVECNK